MHDHLDGDSNVLIIHRNSKWGASVSPRVSVVISKELRSVGDVLRELDTRLTSDFILISGDTVGNVDLTDAVAEHRKRRETDKNAIMTMVLMTLGLTLSLFSRKALLNAYG